MPPIEDSDALATPFVFGLADSFEVRRVGAVDEELTVLRSSASDIVIFDWHLAGRCGSEIIETLPRTAGLACQPVIIASRSGEGDVDGRAFGASMVSSKPFTMEDLRRAIRHV